AQKLTLKDVVSFVVDKDELIARLSGRLVCSKCGTSYHEATKPPVKPGVCGLCGSAVIKREDDKPAVVKTRLETFLASTKPVEDFYRTKGRLREVDATRTENEVFL